MLWSLSGPIDGDPIGVKKCGLTFLTDGSRLCPLSEHARRNVPPHQSESVAAFVHGFHAVRCFGRDHQSVPGSFG